VAVSMVAVVSTAVVAGLMGVVAADTARGAKACRSRASRIGVCPFGDCFWSAAWPTAFSYFRHKV
jgi:hypothetical protein